MDIKKNYLMKIGLSMRFKQYYSVFSIFGVMVIFFLPFLVFWFSIYSVPWIQSTDPAHIEQLVVHSITI